MGRQPIAVVGMACRFAGAGSAAELWEVLRNGVDATSETPKDRYDVDALYASAPRAGRVVSRRAGYLPDIDRFDAPFFDLSGAEADHLDPQQRLLMMTAWEALEDAGLPPGTVAASRTGVYVGASYNDYWDLIARSGLRSIDVPALTNFRSLLPGRLSYLFDLRGPSICVDTACSSSLVAVHLACQSIRAGETTMALAAGVSIKLVPDRDVLFSRARVLAPDGRCKFGDASADGAAFSDGVGVVVLKPLDRALADGDRVRAVVLGSAVGNDGASSGSLLAPSVEAHADMLRWAYDNAGVDPAQVDFIEAHGTGTQTIDPVEFAGLSEVLGSGRPADRLCFVGSVKSNIGHTESAAGVAALIKTVLCLENRQVVPSLHFDTPNPNVAWADIPLVVPTAPHTIPARERPAIAGISGQGISSVNAHLVMGQADPAWTPPRPPSVTGRSHLLVLSARSPEALDDLARAYIRHLRTGGPGHGTELRDICHSAATRRGHEAHRLAVIATTHDMLVDKLLAFLSRELADGVCAGGGPNPAPPGADASAADPPSGDARWSARLRETAHQYADGQSVCWEHVNEPGGRFVPLPTYPWQTSRHWFNVPGEDGLGHGRAAEGAGGHTYTEGAVE